ncbi:uncharacterized protein LOC127850813 isoform X2 [Dreissena polymorpha]|nr:uncharacterized protein LOC127850813 isoform X2 [Dreissena polymorpha]
MRPVKTNMKTISEDDKDIQPSKKFKMDTDDTALSEHVNPETPATPVYIQSATCTYLDSGYGSSVGTSQYSFTPQPGSNISSPPDDCASAFTTNMQKGKVKKRIIFKFGPDHLRKYFQKHFVKFKDEVDPKEISDHLFATGVISVRDLEKVAETHGRGKKVDIMIKAIVHSSVINDVNTTTKVLEAFAHNGREDLFNDFNEHIHDQDDMSLQDEFPKERIQSSLKKHERLLNDEIDPLTIIDELLERGVLTFDEHQNIMDIDFKPTKMMCLCQYVFKKPAFAFWEFCQTLIKDPIYKEIGNSLLRKGNDSGEPSQQVEMDLRLDLPFSNCIPNTNGDKNVTEIKFELDSQQLEKMIVDDNSDVGNNDDLKHEAMDLGFDVESLEFSSIKIRLRCLTEQSLLNLRGKSEESLLYIENILKTLITQEHLALMREKNIASMKVTVYIPPPDGKNVKCLCKLTKEEIVKHYTLIEKDLKDVSLLVHAIMQLEGQTKREEWLEAQNDVDSILRLIIDGEDKLVCMLERHLRQTEQLQLLARITSYDETEHVLSAEDLHQRKEIILEEIEPRKFLDMIRRMEGSEAILDKVMTNDVSRRERCEEFLKFVQDKHAEGQFQEELQRQDMTHLITLLSSKATNINSRNAANFREALISTIGTICENIEPLRFKKFMVRPPELSEDKFESICRNNTRKSRVYALIEAIIKGPSILIDRFMEGLDALEYHGLLRLIKENAEKYRDCPRLMGRLEGEVFTIGGTFHINYKNCDSDPESQLQVYLNLQKKMSCPKIDTEFLDGIEDQQGCNAILRDARISEWIRMQQQQGNECNSNLSTEPSDICTPSQPNVHEHSEKQSEETMTTSSHAPTITPRLNSPYPSEYEDITPPITPNFQLTVPSRPYKRKRLKSLSDGSNSNMSSPSSSNSRSPTPAATNSMQSRTKVFQTGEQRYPNNPNKREALWGNLLPVIIKYQLDQMHDS